MTIGNIILWVNCAMTLYWMWCWHECEKEVIRLRKVIEKMRWSEEDRIEQKTGSLWID